MRKRLYKGLCLIGRGIAEMIGAVVGAVVGLVRKAVKAHRQRKLRRYSAYVSKYGYEVGLNSRVRVQGKAYYVMSFSTFEGIDNKREVRLELIGVPQYKEIKRRMMAV